MAMLRSTWSAASALSSSAASIVLRAASAAQRRASLASRDIIRDLRTGGAARGVPRIQRVPGYVESGSGNSPVRLGAEASPTKGGDWSLTPFASRSAGKPSKNPLSPEGV